MTKWWLAFAAAVALLPTGARGAEALSKETISSIDASVNEINNSLSKAVELYRAKKFEEFGKLIGEVEQSLEELKSGDHKELLEAGAGAARSAAGCSA